MSRRETTILGVTYPGRPLVGSLACDLYCYEQQGKSKEAQALLDAHNQIRKAFGQPPIDLAEQFTDVPLEGLITVPTDRAINRVVTRTVRRAA